MTDRDFNKKEGQWFPVMNSLAEKLITYELTKIEHRVMWMFFRFCYGYQNSTCELGWSDMIEITQLPKSSLSKALSGLKERNILKVRNVEGKTATQYKINSKLQIMTSTYPPSTRWSYADTLIYFLSGFAALSQGEYSKYCSQNKNT